MRISVIIPHYPGLPNVDEALQRCVSSLEGPYEILVIVNEGWGFARAANVGLRLAHGEFLFVVNNDTERLSGTLEEMCVVGSVTVPALVPPHRDKMPRSFFCMPRWVYEKVGGYDEQFEVGYFEDDDMIKRFQEARVRIQQVARVQVRHNEGTTMTHMDPAKRMEENGRKFAAKWGTS